FTNQLCHSNFIFTSSRRHTKSKRDWSSDVCSSDLSSTTVCRRGESARGHRLRHPIHSPLPARVMGHPLRRRFVNAISGADLGRRSEERRVGIACRVVWAGVSTKTKAERSN